jgi:hypothetical protein
MSNWISIDPGAPTGVTIWNEHGQRLQTGQVIYENALKYIEAFNRIITRHKLEFALIEKYVVFPFQKRPNSFQVQTQVQLLTEIFHNYITCTYMQWNPARDSERKKKEYCIQIFCEPLANTHQRDSAIMGYRLFNQVNFQLPTQAFTAMKHRAMSVHTWPTAKDMTWLPWWEQYLKQQRQRELNVN